MFDAATLDHVARLARLPLSEPEREAFAREIAAILAEFETLPAGAGPPPPEGGDAPLRADETRPAADSEVEGIVAAFPARDGRLAKVPRGLG